MGKLGVGPMQTYWGEGDVWCVEGVGGVSGVRGMVGVSRGWALVG